MKITALIENTTADKKLKANHGLCLYIETDKHKLLFDMGANDLFLRNAEQLGIDIKAVDTAVISHGHFDHGGGLQQFLQNNDKAKVYINQNAFIL
jgi:7,8-dihydropterin-6-yl-methyl-4-(beta-D-ribofuranosyl)aminobenzene 5'-phosphate synthase